MGASDGMGWPGRRVVTGHDASGRSIVLSDGAPAVIEPVGAGNARVAEIWTTRATPAPLSADEPEPSALPIVVPPPPGGHVIRYFEIEPGWCSPMHRTESLDYGIVLRGEVYMKLDDSEVTLGPGDVVVQRGTDHAWGNRSDSPALMVFVLVDGAFTEDLREAIGDAAARLMVEPPTR